MNLLRTGFFALGLVLTAGTVNAQTTTTDRTPTTTTERNYDTTRTTHDDNHDNWGWIGLLGLLGLAGLMPKKRAIDDRDRNDLNNKNLNR